MNAIRFSLSIFLGLNLIPHLCGQVPHVISYQGRLSAHGTNFNGTGLLKFALASGATNASVQATATPILTYGFLVQINVTNPGWGYITPPAVTIADATGSGAVAAAQVSGGQVTAITILDAGSGYTAPVVTITPPTAGYNVTTFWSNDGTSSAGGEPAQSVPVSVANGLVTVLLGDTTLSNMAPLPPTIFTNADVRLRIWFSDGAGSGFQLLSPDQRISAVGYALVAGSVPDGSITAAKLADATIPAAKLSPEARQELRAPVGSIVLSDQPDATNLTAAGYAPLAGLKVVTEEWQPVPMPNRELALFHGSPVWTGSELIVWGGNDPYAAWSANTGARFLLASNLWIATGLVNAPAARSGHSAIWTGSEMIIWGGGFTSNGTSTSLNSGGRYSPVLDCWTPLTQSNAPAPRMRHSAVWTGTEMIVWGGGRYDSQTGVWSELGDGARYDPTLDTWTPISNVGAPAPCLEAYAIWTGTEMIIWGGNGSAGSAAIYSLAFDDWRPMSTNGALWRGIPIWTGNELIVVTDGPVARYSPSSNLWTLIASPGSPLGGPGVWTGSELIARATYSNPTLWGYKYDPATDQWSPISGATAPALRETSYAYWTGSGMLFFSGDFGAAYLYKPSAPLYLYQKR